MLNLKNKLIIYKCIYWVKDKFKRDGSRYELTKDDIEDIELAYEFQTSGINKVNNNN